MGRNGNINNNNVNNEFEKERRTELHAASVRKRNQLKFVKSENKVHSSSAIKCIRTSCIDRQSVHTQRNAYEYIDTHEHNSNISVAHSRYSQSIHLH